MANLSSKLILSLVDKVSGPAKGISGALSRMNAGAKNFNRTNRQSRGAMMGGVRGLVAMGAGYVGIREGISGTVGAAMSFEDAMSDIRKVIDFKTPQSFQAMRKDILQLSKELPISAEGFAAIYAAAGQSNIPTDKLNKFANMTAQVATAWDMTAGDTGSALAEIRTGLGITVEETGLVADAINHLGNNTAASAGKILSFTQSVASAAKTGGMAASDAAAFGSAMIGAGFDPDIAKTSYLNMMKYLAQGASAPKGRRLALKALGFDPQNLQKQMSKDATGTVLKVLETINDEIPEHQRSEIIGNLFGAEAKALAPLIGNMDELRRSLGLVADETKYAGSAAREYEEASKRTSNSLARLKNNVRAIGIGVGDNILPGLASSAETLADRLMSMDASLSIVGKVKSALGSFGEGLGLGDAGEQVGWFQRQLSSLSDFVFGPDLTGLPSQLQNTLRTEAGGNIDGLAGRMRSLGESIRSFYDSIAGGNFQGALDNLSGIAKGISDLLNVGSVGGYVGVGLGAVVLGKLATTLLRFMPIRAVVFGAIAGGLGASIEVVQSLADGSSISEAIGKLDGLQKALAGVALAYGAFKLFKVGKGIKNLVGGGKGGPTSRGKPKGNAKSPTKPKPGAPEGNRVGPTKPKASVGQTIRTIGKGAGKIVVKVGVKGLGPLGFALDSTEVADAERLDESGQAKLYERGRQTRQGERTGRGYRALNDALTGQPTINPKLELTEALLQSSAAAIKIRERLGVTAKPIVDKTSIDAAVESADRLNRALSAGQRLGMVAGRPAVKIDGARAAGGPVRAGGRFLVGERGPELFTPSRSGYVHDAGATAGMVGGAGRSGSAARGGGANVDSQCSPLTSRRLGSASDQRRRS